ncbi:hypothetical protein [Symbiobacterium thermophilum]|nr:hypothetical protein [Symbiobacterium thermophilum]MBY6277092.1 hypothetical protein [Symbiobacterium thermophilum]
MADTEPKAQGNEAYYATARTLGTGTTSSPTMKIWRVMDDYLARFGRAVSASELAQETGLTVEQIDDIFAQEYYQKHYGFRRFDSLEEWRAWAMETGVLYNPELHRPDPEEPEEVPAEQGEPSEEPSPESPNG